MSYVIAAPEALAAVASDVAGIGSTLSTANAAASGPTTGLLAAGADEVSAAVAALFSEHGQAFQALTSQAAAFHAQFVQNLTSAGAAYAAAEAASASPLQDVLNAVNAPTLALFGRPLIGNGANGGTVGGVGQDGAPGGILIGNGGAGGNSTNPGVAGGNGGAAGIFGMGGPGGLGGSSADGRRWCRWRRRAPVGCSAAVVPAAPEGTAAATGAMAGPAGPVECSASADRM